MANSAIPQSSDTGGKPAAHSPRSHAQLTLARQNIRMPRVLAALLLSAGCAFHAGAQPAKQPASASLLDHLHRQIVAWDRGPTGPAAAAAFQEHDFLQVRSQLRTLGTAAAPLAPRVAEQMVVSTKNKYVLGYMIVDMLPTTPEAEVPEILGQLAGGDQAGRLLALAKLGKSSSGESLEAVRRASTSDDSSTRLMATISLGSLGKAAPEAAARAVALRLQDPERAIRAAAASSLRLIGPASQVVAPELLEYLRSRENIFAATAALAVMPVEAVRPAKTELEAILADPKYGDFLKKPVADLLIRLESGQ